MELVVRYEYSPLRQRLGVMIATIASDIQSGTFMYLMLQNCS